MTPRKKTPPRKPLHISSLSLTSSTATILRRLSDDATDVIGREVSGSAVVRALLHYAEEQTLPWAREHLYPHINGEMVDGTVWGKRKSS